MWISEVIEQRRQRQAAGPIRYGHLRVFEGGKIAEGIYTQPIGFWRRIFTRLCRQHRSLHLGGDTHR